MSAIPRKVLSDAFEKTINGRQIQAGVFLTYRFEPAFFEQEILPVFLDQDVTNVPAIRLVNLEEALIRDVGPIAVYYDRGGLVGEGGSAQLNEARIPVRWNPGVFHSKNVLAIVQDREPDKNDARPRSLLIASISANLTRAGWWENVEACHIEEIPEGGKCAFREDLLYLFKQLRSAGRAFGEPAALPMLHRFVLGLEEWSTRSGKGTLRTHMYTGRESVPEFLWNVLGRRVMGWNLEILSPYMSGGMKLKPLRDLIDQFEPRAVRVLLPRARDEAALVAKGTYGAMEGFPGASWGRLPAEVLRSGPTKEAPPRTVHAKVYRFFSPAEGAEIIFLGSTNLTNAAHTGKGNYETGFVVETEVKGRPSWWLEIDEQVPNEFKSQDEETGANSEIGIRLSVRYDWGRKTAEAYWDDDESSPALRLVAQGIPLFSLGPLSPGRWTALLDEEAVALEARLRSSSFLTVEADGNSPATILVMEEGMPSKPSILFTLTPSEILKYWTLLSPAQREAILFVAMNREGILPPEVVTKSGGLVSMTDSFFDSFAGIFHAFASLERTIFKAIKDGRFTELEYRLFGQRHDSLPTLLDRVCKDPEGDLVDTYVIFLCAKQLLDRFAKEPPDIRRKYRDHVLELENRLKVIDEIRAKFTFDTLKDRERFFDWFDKRFLAHAEPEKVAVE